MIDLKAARDNAILASRYWVDQNLNILDTETTGLDGNAAIIEAAVISLGSGAVLFNRLIKPSRPIPCEASRAHGIFDADVADAANWATVREQFFNAVKNKVLVYNADYGIRLTQQTDTAAGFPAIRPLSAYCVMKAYAAFAGEISLRRPSFKYHKLADAARSLGVSLPEGLRPHRALAGCFLTRGLVKAMALYPLSTEEPRH